MRIYERHKSRDGTMGPDAKGVRNYVIDGTDDESTAQALVNAIVPATWGNLYKQTAELSHQGGGVWHVAVQYGPRNKQSGESEWSFSIGTTQIHTTHSLETVESYIPAGGTEVDYEQAINVVGKEGEIEIEGVDIPSADLTWQETLYLPLAQFTSAYLAILRSAVGKTNASTFRIFGAQEVLLQGVSGRPAGDTVALTFQYAASESKSGLTIGTITGIAKKGWEYLWVRTEETDGVPEAVQVNVEKVIDTYDFATLGVPDPFN